VPWIFPVLLILIVFGVPCSQDFLAGVRDWLPTAVGDRWIYQGEVRSGNMDHPEVELWEQEEWTVAVETVTQGVLIRRKVSFRNHTGVGRLRASAPGESNILVHNGCVYYLEDSPSYGHGYGWDAARQQLGGEFARVLAAGEALPDVCFPLQVGRTWGDPTKGRDLWTVGGLGKKKMDDPNSVAADSWRLEAHLASGDDNFVWFQKGIGVTASRTFHHGTYDDQRVRLLRFERGGR
jgi:hypothetical protein